jgi:Fe-S oxidoreductase
MMFKYDRCNDCGDCFVQCPYADFSRDSAIREIQSLKRGEETAILGQCITCMACNEYCPTGANPYDLILKLQEEKKIHFVEPGVTDFIEATLTGVPNEIIPGDPDRPALNLCVMGHAYPADITESKMFAGLTLVRGSDYFSRAVFLHTGMESRVRSHTENYINNLAKLNKREIIFVHDDCYAMVVKKAPEYGITVPFRAVHIIEYMLGYLQEHTSSIVTLNRKIAYQRPCISRYTPEKEPFLDMLFDLIGAERVARRYDRKNALCCAFGLRETDPVRGAQILKRNLDDALDHGAEAMVFLCPGCYWLTSAACEERGLAAIFATDLCRISLGEIPFASRPWKPV